MKVRRATVSDAPALAAGMAAVADEGRWLATPAGTPPGVLAERFVRALEDGHVLFAAERGEELVGCLGLHPAQAAGVLDLGMWLLPEARGRGGGRKLVEAALAHARSTDAHKVQLEVYPDNGRAIALYAGAGFEPEGIKRNHYRRPDGTLRSALVMSVLL